MLLELLLFPFTVVVVLPLFPILKLLTETPAAECKELSMVLLLPVVPLLLTLPIVFSPVFLFIVVPVQMLVVAVASAIISLLTTFPAELVVIGELLLLLLLLLFIDFRDILTLPVV